mmetsp:Transcript_27253/g.64746  ORF Transcript_27253/g.64746 Transcript_27253/m.64746 type:complete len:88 (+) Transcript_27253:272-535(+)
MSPLSTHLELRRTAKSTRFSRFPSNLCARSRMMPFPNLRARMCPYVPPSRPQEHWRKIRKYAGIDFVVANQNRRKLAQPSKSIELTY